MSGMDRLSDDKLKRMADGLFNALEMQLLDDLGSMARELLAHRRASQAAPAPSDALREALERLEAKASAVSSAHARKGNIGFAVAEMGPTIMSARAALSKIAQHDS